MRASVIGICLLSVCLLLMRPVRATAAAIDISMTNTVLETSSTAIFNGTVTNGTGVPLATSNIFLNFFAFDFSAIASIDQILGVPDVVIDPSTTSAELPLFSVTLDPSATPGILYPIEFFAQDVDGNFSDNYAIGVRLADTQPVPVPEPTSLLLVLGGAGAWCWKSGTRFLRKGGAV